MSLSDLSKQARAGRSTQRRGSDRSALIPSTGAESKPAPSAPVAAVPPPMEPIAAPQPIVAPPAPEPAPQPAPPVVPVVSAATPAPAEPKADGPVSPALDVQEVRGAGLALLADLDVLRDMEAKESAANPATAAANEEELRIIERMSNVIEGLLSGAVGGQLWVPHRGESRTDFVARAMKGSAGKFDAKQWEQKDKTAVMEKFPNNFKGEGW